MEKSSLDFDEDAISMFHTTPLFCQGHLPEKKYRKYTINVSYDNERNFRLLTPQKLDRDTPVTSHNILLPSDTNKLCFIG